MKKAVVIICEVLTDLTLGLWVGGAAMISLAVTNIFDYHKAYGGGTGLAGAVAEPIFKKFFLLLLIAWLVLVAAMLVKKFASKAPGTGTRGVVLGFLVLLMFAAAVGQHCFILPKLHGIRHEAGMEREQALPDGPEKDRFMVWHIISMILMMLNLCFGVGAIGLRASIRWAPSAR